MGRTQNERNLTLLKAEIVKSQDALNKIKPPKENNGLMILEQTGELLLQVLDGNLEAESSWKKKNSIIRIKSKLYALTIEMRQRFGQKHALLVQSTT
jgi:hypothetical protein